MKWPTESLGSLCDVISGETPKRTVNEYWNGKIPWVKISDMLQGEIKYTDESITDRDLRERPARLLEPGTLLLSIFATVGRTALLAIPASTNQAIVGLKIKTENLYQRYLRQYLDSQSKALKSKSRGVAQDNINTSILKSLKIALPPRLEEQRRITAILDKVRSIQNLTEVREEALRSFEESLFNHLFGSTHEQRSRWEWEQFGSLCSSLSVGVVVKPASYYRETGVPALRSLNVKPGAVAEDEIEVHFIWSVVHIDEGLGNLAVQATKLVIAEVSTNTCIGCQNGLARLLA